MAATLRGDYYGANASEPAGVTAETGAKMGRDDTETGTTVVPIPNVTGTNFSWYKQFALDVTGTGSTNISNRNVALSGAASTGLFLFFKAAASYVQAASGNKPADSGSNGNTPAGYTLLSTSKAVYDAASVSSGSTGRNGGFCLIVMGVDNTYVGGAGSAISLPNALLYYDEA